MGEIISDYELALERYGRPRGPFEKDRDRESVYRATATAKCGPKVDHHDVLPEKVDHYDLPSDGPLVPPERWWDQ